MFHAIRLTLAATFVALLTLNPAVQGLPTNANAAGVEGAAATDASKGGCWTCPLTDKFLTPIVAVPDLSLDPFACVYGALTPGTCLYSKVSAALSGRMRFGAYSILRVFSRPLAR
ncbi:hypothetical protein CC2G_004770 [Coprinopsis cinerea AmutBmut pab1-1]|nr:hypothetical protein CC2G_004770 [Coprinopsis cinerea AmutBmut pab1-1]